MQFAAGMVLCITAAILNQADIGLNSFWSMFTHKEVYFSPST